MARNSNKRKNGGSGTRVGNLLRKAAPIAKAAFKTKGSLAGGVASVASSIRNRQKQNNAMVFPTTAPINNNPTVNSKIQSISNAGNNLGNTKFRRDYVNLGGTSGPTPLNINQALATGGLRISSSNSSPSPQMDGSVTEGLAGNNLAGGESNLFQGPSLGSNTPNLPSTNVIATPTLGAQNTPITLPEQAIPDYSQYIPTPIEQQVAQAEDATQNSLQDYLASIQDAPDSSDAYERAQRETDILAKQQIVGDLTGQLNGIVARGQANQLAQVGQGRGIPEAIIGGIQAQIGRETAIAALPVQAQLSAAQGNLEMANENLDMLFKMYSEDAEREYQNKREVKKAVYEFASAKEKRALEKMDKLEERAYDEKQTLLKTNQSIAMEAAKNGAPASVLSKIAAATTFGDAIVAAGKWSSDPLDRAIKQAQLGKLNAENNTGSTNIGAPGTKPTGKPDFVAAGFASRAEEANKILSDVEKNKNNLLSNSLGFFRKANNAIKPKALQNYEQAQGNFLRAVLRKESGAAIPEEELAGYGPVYFTMPGDNDEVILQKQRARIDALNSLIGASGSAYGGTFQSKTSSYGKASYALDTEAYLDSITNVLNSTSSLYSQAGYEI